MDVNVYGERMLAYIASLPTSSTLIAYFNIKEQPVVVERLAIFDKHFITCGPKGLWSFVYKVSDIQHLVHRNKTSVAAFVGHQHSSISGGAQFDMIGIGNHITIALKKQKDALYLYTHLTTYTERLDVNGSYIFDIDHSLHYNIEFKNTFNKNARLIPNKYIQKGTLATAYQRDPEWLNVIEKYMVYIKEHKVEANTVWKQVLRSISNNTEV